MTCVKYHIRGQKLTNLCKRRKAGWRERADIGIPRSNDVAYVAAHACMRQKVITVSSISGQRLVHQGASDSLRKGVFEHMHPRPEPVGASRKN